MLVGIERDDVAGPTSIASRFRVALLVGINRGDVAEPTSIASRFRDALLVGIDRDDVAEPTSIASCFRDEGLLGIHRDDVAGPRIKYRRQQQATQKLCLSLPSSVAFRYRAVLLFVTEQCCFSLERNSVDQKRHSVVVA